VKTLETLVIRAQSGNAEAFESMVRRFQDMAVGYGYAVLGDMDQAEDAAQEAFIRAYFDLPALRDPAAFPGWFRQIVFKHIDRIRRSQKAWQIPLDGAREIASRVPGPVELAERRMARDQVFDAIATLPEHQRAVVILFYMRAYSQEEIGSFLEIPVATVKTRLHAARKRLKERMIAVIQDNLTDQRPSRDDNFTRKVMNLFNATIAGDTALVKALLAEDPGLANASGILKSALWNSETPALQVAVMYGRKDIVDLLLAHGADINERDKRWGFTALHQAIDLEFLPDYAVLNMVDFLLARGAQKDIFAFLWLEDIEGVKKLLEQDPALVNASGPNNATPICHASGPEMLRLLLEHNADLSIQMNQDWGDNTPLRWIAQCNRKNPDKLRFLLDWAGIKIDIFLACVLGETETVSALLSADPALVQAETGENHVLEPGLTALHLAAQFGQLELARILLERGADVNAKSALSHHLTPLHLAVWRGKIVQNPTQPLPELAGYSVNRLLPDMPRLLLEHGASVNARDTLRGLTPPGWSQLNLDDETDRSEVAALLREFGATE
jgi:RNA polymerase sigma factor (sigma-70 family)